MKTSTKIEICLAIMVSNYFNSRNLPYYSFRRKTKKYNNSTMPKIPRKKSKTKTKPKNKKFKQKQVSQTNKQTKPPPPQQQNLKDSLSKNNRKRKTSLKLFEGFLSALIIELHSL